MQFRRGQSVRPHAVEESFGRHVPFDAIGSLGSAGSEDPNGVCGFRREARQLKCSQNRQ